MTHGRYLSGGGPPVDDNKAPAGKKLVALLVIIASAVLGGFIVKVISKGLKMPGCEIKALLSKNF